MTAAHLVRVAADVRIRERLDCPRERVDATAVAVVSDALRRVGVEASTARLALDFHPDGGPA